MRDSHLARRRGPGFLDLVGHYKNHLATVEPEATGEAHSRLANWLDACPARAAMAEDRVLARPKA